MNRIIRHYIKSFIITAMATLMALFVPAMPAFAEDTTTVDTTNTSNQAAGTAPADVVAAPVTPVPEPTPPPVEVPPVEVPVIVTEPVPATTEQPVPINEAAVVTTVTETATQQLQPPAEDSNTSEQFLAPLATQPDGVSSTTVENTLDSNATTGNADVHHNETGGNATTGNAAAIATIMNILSSITSWSGAPLNTFSQDITGDVFGDLTIDPRVMSNATQVAKKPADSLAGSMDTESRITNDINLSATSGNAGVYNNTTGGNATTGDANVLLNLINIINSWAAANESFLGMINIYGNLNGDILLPEAFLQQLFASNDANSGVGVSGNVATETTMGIENNISLEAQTGEATVHHNDQAGSATTGDALTKLTILNLTNRQIIGSDAILVFVNVLGNWVGMIVNAPEGATAAALGNAGATSTGGVEANIDMNTDAQIVNNINLSARSGDATVHHNSNGGDATTGDATTSANLVNIINSQLSFSDWFGILFINVFGSWNGSFGLDTSAGEVVENPAPEETLITFSPAAVTKNVVAKSAYTRITIINDEDDDQNQAVLSVRVDGGSDAQAPAFLNVNNLPIVMALGGLGCFTVLGAVEKRRQGIRRFRVDSQIIWPTI